MAKGYRKGRLAEEIRKIISDMLLRDLTDPGLRTGMVSVSAVEVTEDASYATVYISILGKSVDADADETEKEAVLQALGRAKGLIRKEINKKVKLHHIPDLIFKIDSSMEYGRHISKVIDSLDIPKDELPAITEETDGDRDEE